MCTVLIVYTQATLGTQWLHSAFYWWRELFGVNLYR